ncbi:uncharacterized protein LOC109197114 isoform X1 [Oreochromis niloticus]|uniref:uncharacterized protein LOC109197114 isoform X1 n=1 Tax=Oreochromis niloticus TaxID=8128 RepID=UPI00090546B5|nr:uncharacterized protein LOC109197114 isoform X1 [Oreochromis niloticus]
MLSFARAGELFCRGLQSYQTASLTERLRRPFGENRKCVRKTESGKLFSENTNKQTNYVLRRQHSRKRKCLLLLSYSARLSCLLCLPVQTRKPSQDEQFDPDMQHPSFKNRVDLQDRQMKDGDVSLILKNVTTADSGTYKCYVVQRVREPLSLISIINLIIYPDPKNITAESGQNVTLPCRVTNDNNKIIAVEWSRPDLGNKHVLLYQDGHFDPYYHNERFDLDHQHPSFKNRVDLQDRQMKDGDVSLILKNVTINDTGTYECRVFMEETRSWKNSITGTINLTVVFPPGQRGGDTENRFVGLIVSGLLIAVAGFLFCFVLKKTVKVS